MNIIEKLYSLWSNVNYPFLIDNKEELNFNDIYNQKIVDLSKVKSGDVVALIGDINAKTILIFLKLIERKAIIVPLTIYTRSQHKYFFKTALVDFVIKDDQLLSLKHFNKHMLIQTLRLRNHAGLILFSTGVTGPPKAILHDLTLFMKRFETPRPSLRTINFLLFDHIGGINTLFHTLFNKGTVVAPKSRNVSDILTACDVYKINVLPTTPTFLRMMLMSGLIPKNIPSSLGIITYGTERMDQITLNELCELLPNVDFRQTYGMSELGIVRVKSKARDSLFMNIGGEGIKTRIVNNVLEINSKTRMLGYLNAKNPFDSDGWYNTCDIVEARGDYYKIIGRTNEQINIGGLKFMASEVENIVTQYDHVLFAKVVSKTNPITGQHIELTIHPKTDGAINKTDLKKFLSKKLPRHMVPRRINFAPIDIGHRFKKI